MPPTSLPRIISRLKYGHQCIIDIKRKLPENFNQVSPETTEMDIHQYGCIP